MCYCKSITWWHFSEMLPLKNKNGFNLLKAFIMETLSLRQKLHSLIENSPEEKLMEVFAIFEQEYTDEFKSDLDDDYADYKNNGEIISKAQLDDVIGKLLADQ